MAKRKTCTLTEFVARFPREVRLYQIAEQLGINNTQLSLMLKGHPASAPVAAKLARYGIVAPRRGASV